ncbi:hypothetical protein [Gellertiella hungarica]|uniref:Lipoprotein n=1 Tax=Gellertiella hungarica TaxID=1572859 RepID=A0A7W6J9C1_9HYPH|nr:hypothetical protein [Gellertiella hungarica]MBB4067156.1 hypothetical protein [Gellertiella hungarica]
MFRKIVVFGCAVVLTGCVTQEQIKKINASARPATASEKALIVSAARDYLIDPYSVRDAEISDVRTLLDTGYLAVCVKANSKNRMGGYTGRTATSVRFKDGKIVGALQDAPGCYMPEVKYYSFPELEALRNL